LNHREDHFVEFLHGGIFTLPVISDFLHDNIIIWLRIGDVAEGKDFFGLISARESR
jgi:hypothetical protein